MTRRAPDWAFLLASSEGEEGCRRGAIAGLAWHGVHAFGVPIDTVRSGRGTRKL